ncbi:MAG TPA: DUF4388 domain-containing protein [Oculatellaceae cyanobacterium]
MIEGSFSDVSLPALMQLLCLEASKSFRIRVTSDNQKGYVLIRHGAIIAAQFGILEGEDAVCEFLSWSQGTFLAEQVVAQTDVEKNLREEIRPNPSFIEDCSILAERQIGLNSEITGSDQFGSPGWKELINEYPLDRECFSVLAWLREGRKMRLAVREFGFDIVRALHILALLVRTQSVQVIRPGSVQQSQTRGAVEYNVVSTTGGQQEAAAMLAKEAARTLETSDVGGDSFVSKSYKAPSTPIAAKTDSVNSDTPSGEFTASRASMEARLRAKRTGNNLPALTSAATTAGGGNPASVANAAVPPTTQATSNMESSPIAELPKVQKPDLNAVLQNQPRRIIDTSDVAKPTGVSTSSTNDAANVRQANLKQGKSGHKNGDSKGQVVLSDVKPGQQNVSGVNEVRPAAASLDQVSASLPQASAIPEPVVPAVAQIAASAAAPVASGAPAPAAAGTTAAGSRSPSPFAKLAKSIHDQKNKWTGQAADAVVTTEQPSSAEDMRPTAAKATPSSDGSTLSFAPQPAHQSPSVTPAEAAPAALPVQNPPAVSKATPPAAVAAASQLHPVVAAPPEKSVTSTIKEKAAASGADSSSSPTTIPQKPKQEPQPSVQAKPPAKPEVAKRIEPALQNKPASPAAESSPKPPSIVPEKPASPTVARDAAEKVVQKEVAQKPTAEKAQQPEPAAFIPADDRRFVAKTQAMPLVAFDIERLLQTTFFATQFGKLALGNPSLDPHRRQTLLDAEYGKTLAGAIEEGNRLPSAVLSSYRYCLDRGYIETHDPVIPLTADLLLGRMEIDQYLLQRRRITGDELRDLMKTAREEGIKLTQILVRSGYLTEADMETLGREQKRFAYKGK